MGADAEDDERGEPSEAGDRFDGAACIALARLHDRPEDVAAGLREEVRKLATLLEFGNALHAAQDLDALLASVLAAALRATGAERAYLFLLEGEPGARRLLPRLSRLAEGGGAAEVLALEEDARRIVPRALGLPESVLSASIDRAEPIVISVDPPSCAAAPAADAASATEAPGSASAASDSGIVGALPPALLLSAQVRGLRSVACVPLRGRERPLGLLYLDNRLVRGLFGAREVELVVAFAAQAGLAIESARARDELARANRLLRETQAQLVQSAKMSAIGQLAAGVSHEIRNPLHIIGGSIYALKERLKTSSDPKVREYLGHVESEVARAAALTERLLDFARPSNAPMGPLDASEVVRRSLPLVAATAVRRDVALESDLALGLPPVQGSACELQQVVVNLLLNAAQAIEEPGGRVRVRTAALSGDVMIEVADTGRGIAALDRERLFEPFFTRREGGTGLGLSVCWGIVERHGGRISVASEPGRGATFTVRLPALAHTESEHGPITPAVAASAA